ncbi:hypothetical protein KKB40_00175 [Patescibacteria group bacterium]|nr:hypothetical protein [Patescibacteria group bacterium]
MTQVSKFMIKPEIWEKIFDMFLDAFLFSKDKRKLNNFVQSIFTPTERIMFAKRFSACILLAKGHDYRNVARILRMSPSTIAKMNFKLKYEGDGLMPIIEDTLKKQSKSIFWKEVGNLLDLPTKSTIHDSGRVRRQHQKRQKVKRMKSEF